MIFVSFGNAPAEQSFIRMSEAIDKLGQVLNEDILVQSGNTLYEFRNVNTVKFMEHSEMMNAMKDASIVILQGGWGTISEAIMLKKKIISIPRRVGQECKHPQEEIVRFLEREGCLLGCYDTTYLPAIIEKARSYEFKPLKRGDASKVINDFISSL